MNDHAPLLERIFDLVPTEGSYPIEMVQGTVPEYLRGTYYLNGPARFHRGDQRYGHWLDGDGMVCSLRFTADGVHFTNRFVRSTKFCAEEAAGRALYRTFGTRFDDDQLVHGLALESPVNVSVYAFADKLLAFGEQGLPWELDPVTLETRGRYTFGRRLNPISPFSAHAHIDPDSGELFNFGIAFGASQPCINLYRFNAEGEMGYRKRLPIEHPVSIHDFSLSPTWAIFFISPHLLDMSAMMQGQTIIESLSWRPELGSRLLIARREDGEAVASIAIGAGYCLHLINSFERDGKLVVDAVELDQPIYDQYSVPDLFTAVRRSQPRRYVIDVENEALVETHSLDDHRMADFPAIEPRCWGREYRKFWMLGISATEKEGRKFFDQVVCGDWQEGTVEAWQAPPKHYLGGEPVFLLDPQDAKRGAVICQQFDAAAQSSSFLLFDAFDVPRGPVAHLELKSPIHLGFHTTYVPD